MGVSLRTTAAIIAPAVSRGHLQHHHSDVVLRLHVAEEVMKPVEDAARDLLRAELARKPGDEVAQALVAELLAARVHGLAHPVRVEEHAVAGMERHRALLERGLLDHPEEK